jgi:hypothetical protein
VRAPRGDDALTCGKRKVISPCIAEEVAMQVAFDDRRESRPGILNAESRMNARGRIDGIDFWRGFALLTIFINHVSDNVISHITHKNFGFSDAAELFVFLAGASVALAYGSHFFNDAKSLGNRTWSGIRAVARRIVTLYWVQILLTFLVIALFTAAAYLLDEDELMDDEDRDVVLEQPARGIVAVLGLTHQLDFINILPLYIVLLIGAPALLMLARRSSWLMLLGSAGVYVVARVLSVNLRTWPLEGDWFFNPFAWQLLLATGVFVGLRLRNRGIPHDARLFAAALIVVVLSLVMATDVFSLAPGFAESARNLLDRSKTNLGVVRIAHFLALAYVVYYCGATQLARTTAIFKPLALMGRYSLPVFATGTVLTAIAQIIAEVCPEDLRYRPVLDLAVVAAGILVQYAAARYLAARAEARSRAQPIASLRPAIRTGAIASAGRRALAALSVSAAATRLRVGMHSLRPAVRSAAQRRLIPATRKASMRK